MDLGVLYENYIKKDDLFECQLMVFALEQQVFSDETHLINLSKIAPYSRS